MQSRQYRDTGKPKVGTMPYSYQMTSRFLYSSQYHRQYCTLQASGQFIAIYMHHLEPLSFEPQPGRMSHRCCPSHAVHDCRWFTVSNTRRCKNAWNMSHWGLAIAATCPAGSIPAWCRIFRESLTRLRKLLHDHNA